MLTDIEIAQQTEMKPIADIAADLGVRRMSWSRMAATRRS